uniref:RNA-directed RNA polymerase n=1 Tax=Suncus murinus ribovirus 3 TaxID=3139577 RepID=A0AB38ZKI4_9VIRU
MFLKQEKYLDEKPPRAIQFRSAEYTLELGRYIKPYEKAMYETVLGPSGTPVFAKSRNAEERAQLCIDKWGHFKNPICYQIDYSKFDAHVTPAHLRSQHKAYAAAFGNDPYLLWLLSLQIKNLGYTKHGQRYISNGRRMSGDIDTGCGNSKINYDVLRKIFPEADYLIDGDDCLVFCEKGTNCPSGAFGFTFKSKLFTELSGLMFCSSRLMLTVGRFVRDYREVISKHSHTYRNIPGAEARLLASIGMCELALGAGVPILQEFGLLLAASSDKLLADWELDYKLQGLVPRVLEVSDEARLEFYNIFEMLPSEQLAFETSLFTPHSVIRLLHGSNTTWKRERTVIGVLGSAQGPLFRLTSSRQLRQPVEEHPPAPKSSWDWETF